MLCPEILKQSIVRRIRRAKTDPRLAWQESLVRILGLQHLAASGGGIIDFKMVI